MTTTPTASHIRNIPDDAPASAFAPTPVGAYRRGFEDRTYDNAWFCPYKPGSADAREYAAWRRCGAAKMERSELQ
jgi:hypothetical protein